MRFNSLLIVLQFCSAEILQNCFVIIWLILYIDLPVYNFIECCRLCLVNVYYESFFEKCKVLPSLLLTFLFFLSFYISFCRTDGRKLGFFPTSINSNFSVFECTSLIF